MERLPFRVNRDADLAKRFATAISKAPLVPLAVTGAAGGILAEQVITAPVAYAQEQKDCFVNIEVRRPTAGKEHALTDEAILPVSCNGDELIELNAAEKGSVRVKTPKYIGPLASFAIGMFAIAAAGWGLVQSGGGLVRR